MTVIRYIHQNPVKAGIVKRTLDWNWSSCHGYYGEKSSPPGLLNPELILSLLVDRTDSAVENFRQYDEALNEDRCLDQISKARLTDAAAKTEITKLISASDLGAIKSLPKAKRDRLLIQIKHMEGITQRQAARILGI